MPFESSYQEELRRSKEYHFNEKRVQGYANTATPQLAASVVNHAQMNPATDGKTSYALAAGGYEADSPVAQEVAVKKINKKGGGFWSGGPGAIVGRAARGAIRNGLAGLESPFQFVSALGRDIASTGGAAGRIGAGALAGAGTGAAIGGVAGGGVLSWLSAPVGAAIGAVAGGALGAAADPIEGHANNPFLQTTVGQMVDGQGLGGGYIPRGPAHEAMVKQQQEAASVHGHALTGGRLLADGLFKPGSREYDFASGVIDATLMVKFDPVIHVGAEVKALRMQNKLFTPSERLRTPLQKAFGMIRSETKMVDMEKVATDAIAHPDVLSWAEKMAAEKDGAKIWNMTNRKIPIDAANKIAAAESAQDVLDVVKTGIQSGGIAEKAAIEQSGKISSAWRGYRQNSRLLAQMPGGGLDLKDMGIANSRKLEKATARWDDWLKNASMPEEIRSKAVNEMMQVKNSTEAEAVVQKYILDDFQGQLMGRVKLSDVERRAGKGRFGTNLRESKWGWDKQKVDSVLGEWAKVRDDLKELLHEEIGMNADVPAAVLDRRLVPVAKAHTVSEVVENVIPLPNIREVRRIMNPNESLAKIYTSDTWKGSIALADKFMTQLWRPLVLLRPAFTVRMLGEETARMVANGMDAPLLHPFSIITSMLTPSERISEAVGVTGNAHAMSFQHAEAQIDLEALHHDAGIMSKHTEIYKTTTPEGAQAWAGKMLHANNDALSRHLVDEGIDSAKEWWWSGEGKALREDYTARTGKAFTREQSDLQVVKQHEWIMELTGQDPALMHAISSGYIPTKMDVTHGPGVKWVSATKADEAAQAPLRTRMSEIDAELNRSAEDIQDELDYYLSHAHDQPGGPKNLKEYRAPLRKERRELEKKLKEIGDQPGHWDQELDQPLYFHGTQQVDEAGVLRSVQTADDTNLVGPGFYTTHDPEIASSYTGAEGAAQDLHEVFKESLAEVERIGRSPKFFYSGHRGEEGYDKLTASLKAKIAERDATYRPAVHRMTWRDPANPPNLLNLEKPLPSAIRKIYDDALQDALDHVEGQLRGGKLRGAAKQDAVDEATRLQRALDRRATTAADARGFDVVHQTMLVLNDADKAEVLRLLQEKGFDGVAHIGGDISKGTPHQVSVFFDPHKLGPAENVIPRTTTYTPRAGERGIPLKRTDGRGLIHDEAKEHLLKLGLDPNFKSPTEMSGAKPMTQVYKGRMGRSVRWMFEHSMALPSKTFIRSPAFNQAYWNKMIDTMPLMTTEAKAAAIASLDHEGVMISSRVRNQMHAAAANSTGGIVALEDADMLAKGHALDFVSKTFEDLTGRNAIDEAVRHIAPFARAWRESSKKWITTLAADPVAARKLQRVLTAGGIEGEGKQGQGFFYKDENDQWVFNYPASGLISKIIPGKGVPFPMKASLGAVTPSLGGATSGGMGHALVPGAGPMVSMAASHFLPDTPTYDSAREWLAPYGDPAAKGIANSLLPPWASKLKQAFDDPNVAGLHANTVMDTARYLMSTGDYDTSTDEGSEKLLNDAKKAAKNMTILRAVAQFFSPSSPTPIPMAEDPSGHLMVAKLLGEDLHNMQEKDFDGAVGEFLGKYGDQGMLYLQGNTRGVNPGGREDDKGFDFLRNNPDLTSALPLTAGLFAPPEGDFEYAAYLRAFHVGDRQRITPKQMIGLANDKVASMIYYNARDQLDAKGLATKDEGRLALAQIKALLMDKYPGFNTVIGGLVEKAKTPQVIAELEKAVTLPKVMDTAVGKATSQYLEVRKKLNEEAETRGYKGFQSSEKTSDLRLAARKIGQLLISETPGFALVYDRIFDGEMKDDVTNG